MSSPIEGSTAAPRASTSSGGGNAGFGIATTRIPAACADRIDYRLGPGLETMQTLEGPFDLVFIDADKEGYVDYYEAALPLLADGGLIVADNVLWSGRVAEDDPDERTRTIMAFNEHVRNDERVVAVMLTVRDGMTLIRKR